MNAMLMSFWHLFFISDFLLFQKQDFRNINVGAGDLATGPYKTSLTRGDYFHKYCQEYLLCFYEVENTFKFTPPNPDYISTHTLLTNMYNDMTTSSLPVSVLEFPLFFTLQKKNFFWNRNDDRLDTYSRALMSEWYYRTNEVKDITTSFDINIKQISNMIEMLNITDETMRNYHYLWYSYNNNKKLTMFCAKGFFNSGCNEMPLRFHLAEEDWHFDVVELIRNKSVEGMLIEDDSSYVPCQDQNTQKKFEIESICGFLQNISTNKLAFLSLMKYTKQSPVYQEGSCIICSIAQLQS